MAPRHITRERETDGAEDIVVHIGREELVVRRRYEFLSILNDFLIGFWFLIGSVAFFSPAWEEIGIWLFVVGSAELLVRPIIRLAHYIQLRRTPASNWDL